MRQIFVQLRLRPNFILKHLSLFLVLMLLVGHSIGAQAEKKYYIRSSAGTIQAYWKGDELIVGINIEIEGRTEPSEAIGNSTRGALDTQKNMGRLISIVVVKKRKAKLYKVHTSHTSDDTVYPYGGTVYLKTSNTGVAKLVGNTFKKVPSKTEKGEDLWIKIINQKLKRLSWNVFSLWDEGRDEIESRSHLSESCRVKLSHQTLFIHREMNRADSEDEYPKCRYYLTGLKGEDPLVFADLSGDFITVTKEEYEKSFKTEVF